MKIAFTGAHGVGKTTLINSLKERLSQEKDVEVTKEVPRIICELANEPEYFRRGNNTLPKQLVILLGQVVLEYNSKKSNLLICDRTIFDHWAYTTYLFKEEINESLSTSIEHFLFEHMKSYDKIFYLPIEFEVQDDGTRESDKKFQSNIDTIILKNLKKNELEYIEITGSVEERTETVIHEITK